MVKQRMSSADVAAEVACLSQKIIGLRVANIYDLSPKTYVLKLAKSGDDGDKVFLLLESGSRFHTTELNRDKSDIPSNFTLKLRKHIRTRRLEAVRQLGVDRMVDFVFGVGEKAHHLILEMYSQGNIILTDHRYEVLTLLRSHRDDEKGLAIMARHSYPMHAVRLKAVVTEEQLQAALAAADEKATLKSVLSSLMPYGPNIVEHVILDAQLQADAPLAAAASGAGRQLSPEQMSAIMAALGRLEDWFAAMEQGQVPAGYITCAPAGGRGKKAKAQQDAEPAAGEPDIYQDYNPLLLHQSKHMKNLDFPTFDAALDEFYSKIEGQRAQLARADAEKNALSKLDKFKADQDARAAALLKEAEQCELKATLIEYNLTAVDAAIAAVNESLASGMDWRDLERLIKEERKAGNPVAGLIHSLQLEQNQVSLLLSNYLDDEEGDEESNTRAATKVSVDLGSSAHANARMYHEQRKRHEAKHAKTLAANESALQAAEKKAKQQLEQVRNTATVPQAVRKPFWFERFHWCISPENYLIISGRDAQQNELLVKRYFRKGDVYVHADLHGASSTIVKNPDPEKPIPPLTLQVAGCACTCRSRAWDNKIVTSAWWVHHHQVSKTAPTGEYLVTGSFMIRGKKNYLPPQPLVFGLAFMFKLEPSCIANHIGERVVRGGLDADGASVMPETEMEEVDIPVDDLDGEDGEGQSSGGTSRQLSTAASSSQPSALDRFLEASADPFASSTGRFERYGLDASMSAADSVDDDGAAAAGSGSAAQNTGRRHLSAKERELRKKGVVKPSVSHGPSQEAEEISFVGGEEPEPAPVSKQHQHHQQQKQKHSQQQQQQQQQQSKQPPQQSKQQQQQQQGKQQQSKPSAGKQSTVPEPSGQRGKKAQVKKLKEKYADQDEEERQLALAVLGSQGEKKTRADRRKERKERKESVRRRTGGSGPAGPGEDELQEAIARATGKQFTGKQSATGDDSASEGSDSEDEETAPAAPTNHSSRSHGDAHAPANGPASASNPTAQYHDTALAHSISSVASANGLGAQHAHGKPDRTDQTDGQNGEGLSGSDQEEEVASEDGDGDGVDENEKAEIAALLSAENLPPELGDEDKEKLTVLDSLTGCPHAEDILLAAIPVCGPYSALQSYKHKVKLIPGTTKKGKAARQAVEVLSRQPDTTARERELIRSIPEIEIINQLVGLVKLSVPGLQKIKADEKAAKKSKAKAKASQG